MHGHRIAPLAHQPDLVDSLLHPRAVEIRRLLHEPPADPSAPFLIDDEPNIELAVRAGLTIEAAFWAGDAGDGLRLRGLLPPDVPVREVAWRTCKKLFGNARVSRVFAIARPSRACTLDDLARLGRDLVALEGVAIAGNAGAIVRTAAALSAGGVVLLNADPRFVRDRRLIRASRGHVFSLPVVTAGTDDLLRFRTRHRWTLVVARPSAGCGVRELSALEGPHILVFGSERTGCSPQLAGAADVHVAIPANPRVESLNVSVAAGIVLHHRFEMNAKRR